MADSRTSVAARLARAQKASSVLPLSMRMGRETSTLMPGLSARPSAKSPSNTTFTKRTTPIEVFSSRPIFTAGGSANSSIRLSIESVLQPPMVSHPLPAGQCPDRPAPAADGLFRPVISNTLANGRTPEGDFGASGQGSKAPCRSAASYSRACLQPGSIRRRAFVVSVSADGGTKPSSALLCHLRRPPFRDPQSRYGGGARRWSEKVSGYPEKLSGFPDNTLVRLNSGERP